MEKKFLGILGSTGSIGQQALEVVATHPERYAVYSLSTNKNIELLQQQIEKFQPKVVHVADAKRAQTLRAAMGNCSTRVLSGEEGIRETTGSPQIDLVLVAVSGIAGLVPVMAALEAGKSLGLANKESLVAAGNLVMAKAEEKQVKIIPVDSEHSAIFQCLQGESREISRLLLSASGGPFRNFTAAEMQTVTPEQALAHPNWSMGKRISIDSATMMNKGLEIIEAKWLFDVPFSKIEVLVHPQSIVHSMVEYIDGSVLANLAVPSMKIPIQYAFSWPERIHGNNLIDFNQYNLITFEAPKQDLFPCLRIACEAGEAGGIMPTILNAADEIAVELFLQRRISFCEIAWLVERTLDAFANEPAKDLETVFEADRRARDVAVCLAANL